MFERPRSRRRALPRTAGDGPPRDPSPEVVWSALADPTRWRILEMLRGGERSSGEIAAAFDVRWPTISRHLAVLEAAALVRRDVRGRRRLFVADVAGFERAALALREVAPAGAAPVAERPAAASAPVANLPVPLDLFVGRRDELAELAGLVGHSRVLTLAGPPGVGKTRLARELAGQMGGVFAHGVRWVELALVPDASGCLRAVAQAVMPNENGDAGGPDALAGRLAGKHMLLVLDNCEHVREACAEMAAAIARASPQVTVLATSRAPLSVAAERVWMVPSLSVPDSSDATGGSEPESVQLFEARARLLRPRFSAAAQGTAVRELCRRLDGLPLAIELAAARIGVLTPAEMVERLGERFDLLVGGAESDLDRHQTLRATLDWSYDLLSAAEQLLLTRLSVFVGGGDLAAVEAVCGSDGGTVLPALTTLVSSSLVVGDTSGRRARYRLLETIRADGQDRAAASGESAALHRRHLRWFVGLAEMAEPALAGGDAPRWLERLDADEDNLRSAMDWATETGDAEAAARIAAAMVMYWRVRNRFAEGRRRLESVVARSTGLPARLRIRALWGAGFMALMLNDVEDAARSLEACLALAVDAGDTRGRARALLLLGNVAMLDSGAQSAGTPAVFQLLHDAAGFARRAADPWCLSHALSLLGWARTEMGDTAGARRALEDAVAVARPVMDRQSLRIGLTMLGRLAQIDGDRAAAERMLSQAMVISEELGDWHGVEAALLTLSEIAASRGDYEHAEALLGRAAVLFRRSGASEFPALHGLGDVALSRGDVDTARLRYHEAAAIADRTNDGRATLGLGRAALASGDLPLAKVHFSRVSAKHGARMEADAIAGLAAVARAEGDGSRAASLEHRVLEMRRKFGDAPGIVETLENIAHLAGERGRHDHAVRLLGAAEALTEGAGLARSHGRQSDCERSVANAKKALGARAFRTAFAAGRDLTLEQAIDYATRGRGARGRPRMGWGSITQAERQVVAMAVEGLSNAEIASRLFISPSTAAWHLSQVYGKLGIRSRTQLAREVARELAANRDRPSTPS